MSTPAPAKVSDELMTQQPLSAAATAIYESVDSCVDLDQLHEIARLLWNGYAQEKISEGEAAYLSSIIQRRRPLPHTALSAKPAGRFAGRLSSRFTPRQRQRSPDRKASRDRRRMLGGSSALPDNLRHHYTEGQRSVLCIVAGEVKRCGVCDFSHRQDCGARGRLSDDGADHTARGTTVRSHQNHRTSAARPQELTQRSRDHLIRMAHLDTARPVCCPPDRVQFSEKGESHEEQRSK